jgi:hypothetical protein
MRQRAEMQARKRAEEEKQRQQRYVSSTVRECGVFHLFCIIGLKLVKLTITAGFWSDNDVKRRKL